MGYGWLNGPEKLIDFIVPSLSSMGDADVGRIRASCVLVRANEGQDRCPKAACVKRLHRQLGMITEVDVEDVNETRFCNMSYWQIQR